MATLTKWLTLNWFSKKAANQREFKLDESTERLAFASVFQDAKKLDKKHACPNHSTIELLCEFCLTQLFADEMWERLWDQRSRTEHPDPQSDTSALPTSLSAATVQRTWRQLVDSTGQRCPLCQLIYDQVVQAISRFYPRYYKNYRHYFVTRNFDRSLQVFEEALFTYHVSLQTWRQDADPGGVLHGLELILTGTDHNHWELRTSNIPIHLGLSSLPVDVHDCSEKKSTAPERDVQWPVLPISRNLSCSRNKYSNFDASAVRGWISECLTSHPHCPRPTSSTLPNRLLDVLAPSSPHGIRLITATSQLASQYALVSYYGESQVKLTTQNLAILESTVDHSSLLPYFRDSVTVARELGIRYLWIAALCIIHDDDGHDMNLELSQLANYHKNATLVIAGTTSYGCDEGFLSTRNYSCAALDLPQLHQTVCRYQEIPMIRSDGSKRHVLADLAETDRRHVYDTDRPPLLERMGALQETLSSPRILHVISEEACVLVCDEATRLLGPPSTRGTKRFEAIAQRLHPVEDTTEVSMDQILCRWNDLVDQHMVTYGTAKDRLPKIAMLAGHFHQAYHHILGDYIAGVWSKSLPQSLMWWSYLPRLASNECYAPSWSWAAAENAQMMPIDPKAQLAPDFKILSHGIVLESPNWKHGPVKSAEIVFRGRMKRIQWQHNDGFGKTVRKAVEELKDQMETPTSNPEQQNQPSTTDEDDPTQDNPESHTERLTSTKIFLSDLFEWVSKDTYDHIDSAKQEMYLVATYIFPHVSRFANSTNSNPQDNIHDDTHETHHHTTRVSDHDTSTATTTVDCQPICVRGFIITKAYESVSENNDDIPVYKRIGITKQYSIPMRKQLDTWKVQTIRLI